MVVKLDIDGVVRNFVEAVELQFRIDYPELGSEIRPVTEWGFEKFYPKHINMLRYVFHDRIKEIFLDMASPYRGAQDAVNAIKEAGHSIFVVTTQPRHGIVYTLKWLDHWGIPYDDIAFTRRKYLVAGDVLIDDSPKNLAEADDHGQFAVCMDRPWNRGYEGYRIKDLRDVLSLLPKVRS